MSYAYAELGISANMPTLRLCRVDSLFPDFLLLLWHFSL
jgi:hypothetical protein